MIKGSFSTTLNKQGVKGNTFELIKTNYKSPTANIKYQYKILNAFTLRSGMKQQCLFTVYIGGCRQNYKAKEKILIENERKLSFFSSIYHLGKSQGIYKKVTRTFKSVWQDYSYKINMQKITYTYLPIQLKCNIPLTTA